MTGLIPYIPRLNILQQLAVKKFVEFLADWQRLGVNPNHP